MWELDYKESWAQKNWCFWTVVLETTLESPLDCKENQPIHPKGNQSWIFIGRTDAEAPILWPPDGKNWLIGKDPDAGKDWRREEKGLTEDEMAGWHHWQWTWVWVNSRSWWWTGRPGELKSMGRRESDTPEWLNWLTDPGFPGCSSSKASACWCRRPQRLGFDPWVRKIPWRSTWQPSPVFLPGEAHGRGAWRAVVLRVTKSQTWVLLSLAPKVFTSKYIL